ncbi:Gfo/Idh/MocA family protein [Paenibacillus mendelii]|uniref:Gfo/Idh/MocA family protein n=1 Tax=Paenibacillus mendelii TaxID=206163 RepID=A0ABV6JDI8_9BACL|nr:Gfo/Idh/MocA family oxidoreductase [Paenibacillus mendelii]MCQ6563541.1 Gfo/Idh/MocA family oxidoreductase [Paenibacillus mendelii]
MEKIRIGLIGLGFMGRMHLENYRRLEQEGAAIQLKAVFDMEPGTFADKAGSGGNVEMKGERIDFSQYACYTDLQQMLEEQELDAVDITVPTYLHADLSIMAMKKGLHVLCEKPMALNAGECQQMLEVARETGRQLMIGQCLRFWPAYEFAKQTVEDHVLGEVTSAYFYRGSGTPDWSHQNWLMEGSRSGGCLLDMHVHDVDIVNWLFGKPLHVSTAAKQVISRNAYDIVSTNYYYEDGKVVNAQADWTLNGDSGLQMEYRINFTGGFIMFDGASVTVHQPGQASRKPELSTEDGYYRELKYFYECLLYNRPILTADPEHIMGTIQIVEAEQQSADRQGVTVTVA